MKESITQEERDALARADFGDPKNRKFPVRNQDDLDSAATLLGKATNPAAVQRRLRVIAARKSLTVPDSWNSGDGKESAPPDYSSDDIRDLLQRAIASDDDPDTDDDDDQLDNPWCEPWVTDVYPDTVVYCYDGTHYQRSYTIDPQGAVTLGAQASEVTRRVSYQPAQPVTVSEANRRHSASDAVHIHMIGTHAKSISDHADALLGEYPLETPDTPVPMESASAVAGDLQESTGSPYEITEAAQGTVAGTSKGEVEIVVIRPGFNLSKSRYYTKEALSEAVAKSYVGRGIHMMVDHPTEDENYTRPEGSLTKLGAIIKEAWIGPDDEIRARAAVVDPELESRLKLMQERDVLSHIGTSIRARGKEGAVRRETVQGVQTDVVEAFADRFRSVDFVTLPGAGGAIALMESAAAPAVVVNPREGTQVELTEAIEQIGALQKQVIELAEANTRNKDDVATAQRRATRAEVRAAIKESGLPTVLTDEIEESFAERTSADGLTEALERARKIYAALAPGKVTGFGGSDMQESRTRTATMDDLLKSAKAVSLLGGSDKAKLLFSSR